MLQIIVPRPGPDNKPVLTRAAIQGGTWTCSDPVFLAVLQKMHLQDGAYYPDYDLELAKLVVSRYTGKIQDTRPKSSRKYPDRVY